MSSIQKQKSDLESIESIQMITRVMRDMSANRIKDLKDSFEKNFEFYKSVGFAFNSIKQLIYQYHTDLAESLKDRPTAHIAITSNHQFYGDLNRRIAETFLKNWDDADDKLMIGKTGQHFISSDPKSKKCEYINFEEDNPTTEEINKIVSWSEKYDKVIVYYPQYEDPFHQVVTSTDISQVEESDNPENLERYIFEPDLPTIHDFFTTQIQYILFERVMLETDLSRTAARLIKMDSAEHTASDMYKQGKHDLRRTIQSEQGIELLETISRLSKWRI